MNGAVVHTSMLEDIMRPVHRLLTSALVSGALGIPASLAVSQSAPKAPATTASMDTGQNVTPTLLRRVAAAVDGHRTGRSVYVVASRMFPHEVRGVFDGVDQARAERSRAGPSFGVFGPYTAPTDYDPPLQPPTCRKQIDSSCPLDPLRPRPYAEPSTAMLIVQMKNGTADTTIFDPAKVEALLFNMSAIDKLLIPYYVRIYGVEYAAELRAQYLQQYKRSPAALSTVPAPNVSRH